MGIGGRRSAPRPPQHSRVRYSHGQHSVEVPTFSSRRAGHETAGRAGARGGANCVWHEGDEERGMLSSGRIGAFDFWAAIVPAISLYELPPVARCRTGRLIWPINSCARPF